jgi:hypothetical protein
MPYAIFNYIGEIKIFPKDVETCHHSGSNDNDILLLSQKSYINRQLANINSDQLAKELKEYGAWDNDELKDHNQNLQRILWIAAWDIIEKK